MRNLGWMDQIPQPKVEIDYDSEMMTISPGTDSKKRKAVHSMAHLFVWIEQSVVDGWKTKYPMEELQEYGNNILKEKNDWEVIQSVDWEDSIPISFMNLRPAEGTFTPSNENKFLCFQFAVFRVKK
jgi:hypothetical protein